MGCRTISGVLLISLVLFLLGQPLLGFCGIFSAYFVLMFYNRMYGDGEATYTYEQCKKEEAEKKRGKSVTPRHSDNSVGR